MKSLKASQMSLQGVPGLSRSRVNLRDALQNSSSSFIACGTLTPTTQERPSSVYMPPGPVVLDQQRDLVAFLDDAVLQMPIAEFRRRAERHRGAEIDAVLAAVALAVLLRDRGDLGVAHAGLHGGESRAHGAVLHQRGALDQLHLLGALDDLDTVDQVGGIDVSALSETRA